MKIKLFISLASILISISLYSQSLPELIKNGNAKLAASDFSGAEKDF